MEAYRAACACDGSTLIEVRTDRKENVALHRELLAGISDR
jgi:2-succinyl-5-enolpyruvyl-6-hydroxy-3-cyclohexene-1-carboxylate synthase